MFQICYGLGGSMGGYGEWENCISCKTMEEAEQFAYDCAVQEYECYGNMYDLETQETIAEANPDWNDDEIMDAWYEEVNSWIVYKAREI